MKTFIIGRRWGDAMQSIILVLSIVLLLPALLAALLACGIPYLLWRIKQLDTEISQLDSLISDFLGSVFDERDAQQPAKPHKRPRLPVNQQT